MNPGKLNLTCPQGSTFSRVFQLYTANDADYNIDGWTALMQARQTHQSANTLFSLTDSDGITISGNEVTFSIAYDVTSTFQPGKYVWDIVITSPSLVRHRILEGILTVTPEVSR